MPSPGTTATEGSVWAGGQPLDYSMHCQSPQVPIKEKDNRIPPEMHPARPLRADWRGEIRSTSSAHCSCNQQGETGGMGSVGGELAWAPGSCSPSSSYHLSGESWGHWCWGCWSWQPCADLLLSGTTHPTVSVTVPLSLPSIPARRKNYTDPTNGGPRPEKRR